MSKGREWIKAIQNTSRLLHALARGIELSRFKVRNKLSITPITVRETNAVPIISYSRTIAEIEWKKSHVYMVSIRNSVR